MDTLYTKLLILNYPMDDPYIKSEYKSTNSCRGRLLPFHFACDLQIYPTVAGKTIMYNMCNKCKGRNKSYNVRVVFFLYIAAFVRSPLPLFCELVVVLCMCMQV